MKKKDRIAELAREEHEFREGRRHAKKKLRGFAKSRPRPRSIRDIRTAGKQENLPPEIAARIVAPHDKEGEKP